MKHRIGTLILAALTLASPLSADELNDLKLEVQKLRERVTELNNSTPILSMKSWGNDFSIGIPVGLFMEDLVVGLELAYPLRENLTLRLNGHLLLDRYTHRSYTWRGIVKQQYAHVIAMPSLTLIGKSPMVYNTRVYGGITAGFASDLLKKSMYSPLVMGVGGIEFYVNKHQVFYLEIGGGAVIPKRPVDYGRGAMITGGSRFYI